MKLKINLIRLSCVFMMILCCCVSSFSQLLIYPNKIDFGTIHFDTTRAVKHNYREVTPVKTIYLYNSGDKEILIQTIYWSCDYCPVEYKEKSIKPKDTVLVDVWCSWDSGFKPFKNQIRVVTNLGEYQIPVSGTFDPGPKFVELDRYIINLKPTEKKQKPLREFADTIVEIRIKNVWSMDLVLDEFAARENLRFLHQHLKIKKGETKTLKLMIHPVFPKDGVGKSSYVYDKISFAVSDGELKQYVLLKVEFEIERR